MLEALRVHVFWRRNYHPEDGLTVRETDKRREVRRRRRDAHPGVMGLLAELKRDVPVFSGLGASDPLDALPLWDLLNVSTEAALDLWDDLWRAAPWKAAGDDGLVVLRATVMDPFLVGPPPAPDHVTGFVHALRNAAAAALPA